MNEVKTKTVEKEPEGNSTDDQFPAPLFYEDRTPIEDRYPLDTPKNDPWYQG